MPNLPDSPPRPGYPASPCNDVCMLDDDSVCVGCKRTMDEIIAWPTMTAKEQWTVVHSLGKRP